MEDFEQEDIQRPRLNKRQLRRIQAVERIQSTALETTTPNRVAKALTFQQGLSVLLRSQQLSEENGGLDPEIKAKQIDACWRIRRGR